MKYINYRKDIAQRLIGTNIKSTLWDIALDIIDATAEDIDESRIFDIDEDDIDARQILNENMEALLTHDYDRWELLKAYCSPVTANYEDAFDVFETELNHIALMSISFKQEEE